MDIHDTAFALDIGIEWPTDTCSLAAVTIHDASNLVSWGWFDV